MSHALALDLYELNMAASYLRRGMADEAVFSLFVRKLPDQRGFLVAGGLEDALQILEDFAFAHEDLEWMYHNRFSDDDVASLASLRFTGDVWAVPEGGVVLANEPLLEVTAPIAEAQIVETHLLNQITYQTAVATKAARCRLAAHDKVELVDFSLRRTHGVEAGMAAARLSAMAGFGATSDVEAARRFGLRAVGTMAHSYVEAFPNESEAFRAFAEDRPGQTTFLVDTYDTMLGVHHAIGVINELDPPGPLAIRLDSGDLGELARQARRALDQAGLERVRIVASGGLDEFELDALVVGGAPIDAVGIGTRLGTSADAPSLDSAYKLVQFGRRPVLKLSTGKVTMPGPKQVHRTERIDEDVIAHRDEPVPSGAEPLLIEMMRQGRRTRPAPTVTESRQRFDHDLARLPASALDLHAPVAPVARFSPRLHEIAADVTANLRNRGLAPSPR